MIHVYQTNHEASRKVCAAFAVGCKGKLADPYPLRDGDVAMYGCLRGLHPTLKQAQVEGRNWYYLDNGYFKAGHFKGYYRVTRNAYQADGVLSELPAKRTQARQRWKKLGIELAPWRKTGRHIVVCPPSILYAALLWHMDADYWLEKTLAELRQLTDRPVSVRHKMKWADIKQGSPELKPLAEDLKDAWALVTHSSNAAVEALVAGVPVICTAPCAAQRIGSKELADIERPYLSGDRYDWACALAAAQWTLKELKRGMAWNYLNSIA